MSTSASNAVGGKRIAFCARKKDGSLKPGIKKAFVMVRNLNFRHLAESGHSIWATSGKFYTPVYDFPLSSLSPEQFETTQKVIVSCQEHEDGQNYGVIRIYYDGPVLSPIEVIDTAVRAITEYQHSLK